MCIYTVDRLVEEEVKIIKQYYIHRHNKNRFSGILYIPAYY